MGSKQYHVMNIHEPRPMMHCCFVLFTGYHGHRSQTWGDYIAIVMITITIFLQFYNYNYDYDYSWKSQITIKL